jgi:hypothetical protein
MIGAYARTLSCTGISTSESRSLGAFLRDRAASAMQKIRRNVAPIRSREPAEIGMEQ